MNDDIPEEGLPEPDSLGRFTIDERFNFTMPEIEPAEDRSEQVEGDTLPTPPGREPDATKLEIGSDGEVDPLIGQVVGNYEVVSQLGRGGFGTVYKARDNKLKRFAALKFLRFPLDPEYRKLFAREAQVIANLGKHPAIVQIYTWGEYQGSYYFALEFLDTSAEGLLESGGEPLSVKQALEIVSECAAALHFAHEQGVLHRDVKPANILIDRKTGDAKVCDFGLAKFHTIGAGTVTSTIAGSPPYMAPEQIAGQEMDGRTDVYSLGVTLYELLSRKLPCTGSSHVDILERIRNRKSTPLRQFRPDLSEAILDIVQTATAYRPEDRYQTAEDMQTAIAGVLKSLDRTGTSGQAGSTAVAPSARGRNLRVPSLVGAAILGVGIVAGLFALPSFRSSDQDSLWPVAVASAKEQIDAGDYDAAVVWINAYLEENPGDDFAYYALGHAHVLSERLDEGETAFAQIANEALKTEGMASVEHARLGEGARSALEAAASRIPGTPYPALLIASLDVLQSHYDQAIARLESLDRAAFYFDWQRRQYNQLIGRAHYNEGNFANVGSLDANGSGISASVSAMYDRMAKRQLDEERRSVLQDKIQSVKELAGRIEADEVDGTDEWTSRPFRVRISPSSPGNSKLAAESGLAEVLPELLADGLVENDTLPIEIVDREFIGDLLFEQQLAELGRDVDRVRLGRLLGARLMIESEFQLIFDENVVRIKIVDTETSALKQLESEEFDRRTDGREWIANLAELTTAKIRESYPVRARLTSDSSGATINVGTNVGVAEGMAFSVLTGPAVEHRLNVSNRVVVETATETGAVVRLEGFSMEAIPADGWFVEELRTP